MNMNKSTNITLGTLGTIRTEVPTYISVDGISNPIVSQQNEQILKQLRSPLPPVSANDREKFADNDNWVYFCNSGIKEDGGKVDEYWLAAVLPLCAKCDDPIYFLWMLLHGNLSKGTFFCDDIGDNGAETIANALKLASTLNIDILLTSLEFLDNNIGDEGAQKLAEVLKTNKTLTLLNFNTNKIGDKGAQAIADALKINKTLIELNLESNCIEGEGVKEIFEALKINSSLTSLNLFNNFFSGTNSDASANALGDMLKTNTTLNELNLKKCGIGWIKRVINNVLVEYETLMLADALKSNSALTHLNLEFNEIGEYGATKIVEALEVNRTLKILQLGGNKAEKYEDITPNTLQKINALLMRNQQS